MKKLCAVAAAIVSLFLLVLYSGSSVSANPIPDTYKKLSIDTFQYTRYSPTTIAVTFHAEGVIGINYEDKARNFTFTYTLDDCPPKKIENITKIADEIIPVNINFYFYNLTGAFVLSNLSEGRHYLTVDQIENSTYYNPQNLSSVTSSTAFTVDIPPIIDKISVENKTYNSTLIPLAFSVTEPISCIRYSLDNEANITLSGNTTLNVQAGQHSLTVYAEDTTGNTGKSDTVFFTVNTATPSPSPSSTQQLTEKPPITESSNFPFEAELAIAAIVVLIICVGIAVMLMRRRKQQFVPN